MLSSRTLILHSVGLLLLVALTGCGGGAPAIVDVEGTLTYKGQPVPNVYIDFHPENGRQSWGLTDDQGHFKLNYDRQHDGAIVGKHKISIRANTGRPSSPRDQDI